MLNAIGLQNPGAEHVVRKILPTLDFSETRFFANVSGSTIEEYAEVTRRFDDSPIDAIEINISCPNVKEGGVAFGNYPDMSAQVVEACRKVTRKPLITKLSPNQTDIQENARHCIEAGTDTQWGELLLAHADWRGIARVERLPVADDTPGARALYALAGPLAGARPVAGADWVWGYLARVRTIYRLRALPGTHEGDGGDAIAAVRNALWSRLDGILQADGQGFTNESGCQVVWQPGGHDPGSTWMAVLKEGAWVRFEMALDDAAQREHFLRGEVPPGAKVASS